MAFWVVFKGFFISVYKGGKIIFSSRRFIWLIPGYTLPLVLHRYLESQLCPAYAKTILKQTAYSQIMVGGSNFGELLGALFVFLFTNAVPSPFPWVRWDALTLNLLWIIPYAYPFSNTFAYAWVLALLLVFVSSGWAAGDVSLSAFIQSSLTQKATASNDEESKVKKPKKTKAKVSPLGAVMSFLYALYIIIYALMSFGLGKVFDYFNSQGNPRTGFFWLAGVLMSIACVIIFISSFIPKGSFAFNPSFADLGVEEEEESPAKDVETSHSKSLENDESDVSA